MVGAVKGPAFVLSAFVWMALFGGVFAVVMLVAEGQLKQTLKRLWTGILLALGMGRFSVVSQSVGTEPFRVFVPYGVAIAVGSAAACIKGWW
jgi:Flp pilus assembly protein protease CpaA